MSKITLAQYEAHRQEFLALAQQLGEDYQGMSLLSRRAAGTADGIIALALEAMCPGSMHYPVLWCERSLQCLRHLYQEELGGLAAATETEHRRPRQ